MPKKRTNVERAAGKLIIVVQREWTTAMGEPGASVSEEVMHNCHILLGAAKSGCLAQELGSRTVTDYLGRSWVRLHPLVLPSIRALESAMAEVLHA